VDSEPPSQAERAQQAPPQFSPDGRFWWDGDRWTPVEQLQRPSRFEDRESHHGDWHDDQESRSLSRVGVLLIGIGAIVLIAWAVLTFGLVKLH
jgi:hypothetical protein